MTCPQNDLSASIQVPHRSPKREKETKRVFSAEGAPATHVRATVITLVVSVPVLSLQMAVAPPIACAPQTSGQSANQSALSPLALACSPHGNGGR